MADQIDVVGTWEIAEMIGVSRQRVDKISRTDAGFPDPAAELRSGRIWWRTDVVAWMSSTGRSTNG